MCCCSAHGRRVSLVAGHSAALGAIVVVVPTMHSTIMRARTRSRGAILLCSIHVLHRKCILCVADVQPSLEAFDLGQIPRLTIRVKESGRCLGLKDASGQMSCRSLVGPAAPLALLLTLDFLASVRVRRRGFGSDGPT